MAGDVDYMLRVAVADMAEYDRFYKRLIALAPMKNVTSRFAMERLKHTTAYPLHPSAFRDRRARRGRRPGIVSSFRDAEKNIRLLPAEIK